MWGEQKKDKKMRERAKEWEDELAHMCAALSKYGDMDEMGFNLWEEGKDELLKWARGGGE